jgi:hypothetical protein
MIGLSAAWVAFAYAGYPALLFVLARFSPREVRRGDAFPPVSVIIAVHNGDHALAAKLEATLALEYPCDVEVIVASDGSTDGTDAVALSYSPRGVSLVRSEPRAGKESAQAVAIREASGEILIFTDLTAELAPDALRHLVRPFADARVGCVSSEDVVDSEAGEGAYVRFEMALRRLENQASTLVGLSGSCFAIRRSLAEPWPVDLASDFRCALEAIRRGLRAVSEPHAGVRFSVTEDPAREWDRKVRTVRRGIAVLAAHRDLLSPRLGRAALSLWGHKVARFTSPLALIVLLVASAVSAADHTWAAVLFGAQCFAYALGALSLVAAPVRAWALPRLAGFFVLVNASMLVAWVHHLSGRRAVTWSPTRRG